MSALNQKFRSGQHVLIRYNGDNGDLVVGRITSVRRNGDVTGVNLLTGAKFRKEYKWLDSRNLIVKKRYADMVVQESHEDRALARKIAVEICNDLLGKNEPQLNARRMERVIKAFAKLTEAEKRAVLPRLLQQEAT